MKNKYPLVESPNLESMSWENRERMIQNLRDIEIKCWGVKMAFTLDQIRSHFSVFPEGIICLYLNKSNYKEYKPSAWALVEIVRYDYLSDLYDWNQISDNGYLKKSHNLNGDWLYGVNLSIPVQTSGKINVSLMFIAVRNVICRYNLRGLIIGSRIPSYHKYCDQYSIRKYIETKRGTRYLDPELCFYHKIGFEFLKDSNDQPIYIKNYFDDPDSCNYGVLVVWKNLDYIF